MWFDTVVDTAEMNLAGLECDKYEEIIPDLFPQFKGLCTCMSVNGTDYMFDCQGGCDTGSGSSSGSDNTGMTTTIQAYEQCADFSYMTLGT